MEYPEFLASLDPVIVGLDSTECSLNRKAFWSPSSDARRVLSSKYTLANVGSDYFDIQAAFTMALQWSENDGPMVQPLKITCTFYGHFHAAVPINRDHAQRFTETESWLMFWPFFRQFVSDITARMSIPPVLIPLALGPGDHSYSRTPRKTLTKGARAAQKRARTTRKK